MFKKATKRQIKLRLALVGPTGSGKTYSSLQIASRIGAKVAVIDTEHGSASKYADLFQFDVCELESFHPQQYINAIAAASQHYDVLVIDSLSHAWMGKDGALELVDQSAKRSQSKNSFNAWREVTPLHNQLVEALLSCKCHLIVTMRAKTEYVMETDHKGKSVPRKVGLAPIQRDGVEYEFDVVGEMTQDNELIVSKSRCPALSGKVITQPGKQVADTLLGWLNSGEAQPETVTQKEVDGENIEMPEVELLERSSQLLGILGWKRKEWLVLSNERYGGKATRQDLSLDELQDLCDYLQEQVEIATVATFPHQEAS